MNKKKLLKLNVFFLLFFFIFFDVPFFAKFSFALVSVSLLFLTYYNLFKEKQFSPFLTVFIVFELLFFIVAPIIQIDSIINSGYKGTGSFVQNFPFEEGIVVRANVYILVFNFFFFFSYVYFKKIRFKEIKNYNYTQIPLFGLIMFFILTLVVIFNLETIIYQYQHEFMDEASQTTVQNYLLVQKFLFYLPIGLLILSYDYIKKNQKTRNYYFVLFFFILAVITTLLLKNPLTEKRNALGPIYILLIFLFYKKIIETNVRLYSFMLFSMVFLFPIASIITHSRDSITDMIHNPHLIAKNIKYSNVGNAFNSLHYDAFPNFLATIDYCDNKEIHYGKQLSCSLFFFVPRSVWHNKPTTTGYEIGQYLMGKYNFHFDNLSNPYVSEGYINFGVFGIILFAIFLAFMFVYLNNWLLGGDILKSAFSFYFAIYLMFFLRGDLTNGIAFITGFFFAIVLVPKIFIAILNYVTKN